MLYAPNVRLLALAAASVLALPAGGLARTTGGDVPPYRPNRLVVDDLARQGAVIYCGGGSKGLVALTFDDGPGPYTSALLRVLRRNRARATFFDVGDRLHEGGGRLPGQQERLGVVGNHTWSHRHLVGLSHDVLAAEIELTEREGAALIGRHMQLFRPSYGEQSLLLARMLRSHGLLEVLWSVDSGDSRPFANPAAVFRTVETAVRPGSIVLLHDLHPWMPQVAARLLKTLRQRHLRPVTVPELVAADPRPLDRRGRPRNDCR